MCPLLVSTRHKVAPQVDTGVTHVSGSLLRAGMHGGPRYGVQQQPSHTHLLACFTLFKAHQTCTIHSMARRGQLPGPALLSVWDAPALLAAGVKETHAVKIWSYLIRHPSGHWSDLPDLPKATKQLLDERFAKFITRVEHCARSADGETTKLLVTLQDGQQVESVIMAYDTRVANSRQQDVPANSEQANNGNGKSRSSASSRLHRGQQDGDDSQLPEQLSEDEEYHSCDDEQEQIDALSLSGQAMPDSCTSLVLEPPVQEGHDSGTALQGLCDITDCACAQDGDLQPSTGLQPPTSSAQTETDCCSQQGRAESRAGPASITGRSMASDTTKAVRGAKRATLCVSSQVGCQMGCTFCATGTMGLKGNLTAGEIIEQLVHANAVSRIRNVVFMGMGEPLANYEPVRAAVRMMTDNRLFGLRRSHVTISTVGVIPRIKQLAADMPGVSLALSLHASNQQLRSTIVPSARAYPLDKLMQAVSQYEQDSRQRVFMEYVMLAGVNDGQEQAHELGQLLQQHNATLNLIPWNPVEAASGDSTGARGKAVAPMAFSAPSQEAILQFHHILRNQYGIPTTMRQEKGQDIAGACGQLVVQQGNKGLGGPAKEICATPVAGKQSTVSRVRDIEDC